MSYHRLFIKIAAAATTIFSTVVAWVSCTQANYNVIPSSAKISYEISYSDNLLNDETIGQFLPHNAVGVYNTNGIKLTATAPFGFVRTTLVYRQNDIYATFDIDKAKFLVSFDDLGHSSCDSLNQNKDLSALDRQNIAGYMSDHYSVKLTDSEGEAITIDLFCIPLGADAKTGQIVVAADSANKPDGKTQDVQFLISALSISYDESNVLFLINNLKAIDELPSDEFERPNGYVETSLNDLIALHRLMDN